MIEIGDVVTELPVKHPVTGMSIGAEPPPSLSCPQCVLLVPEALWQVIIHARCMELQIAGTCRRCDQPISGRVRYYTGYRLLQEGNGWRRVETRPARSKWRRWLDQKLDYIKRKL